MKAADIRVGDVLRLKANNGYGFGPIEVEVTSIKEREGYKVPWIGGVYFAPANTLAGRLGFLDSGSFKPSDFARKA